MNESIKNLDPSSLTGEDAMRQVIVMLLQIIEEQAATIQSLTTEVQELRDEINRLKGQKGKPEFGKKKDDILKKTKEQDTALKEKNHKEGSTKKNIPIDQIVELKQVSCELPADARVKSWEEHIVQNIVLRRENVLYRVAIWYSESEKKTYRSEFALSGQGSFGPELKGLFHLLHYQCNVTQGCLESLSTSLGIRISAGSIDNILKSKAQEAILERNQILSSGIAASSFVQSNRRSGRQYVLQGERREFIYSNFLFTLIDNLF